MVNGWSKQFRDICHTLGCVQPRLGEVYNLELFKKIVQSKCQEDWLKNVSMKPKLRSYVMLKNIFKSESYVKIAHSKMSRSIFAQLRLGILPLEIKTGRLFLVKVECVTFVKTKLRMNYILCASVLFTEITEKYYLMKLF